MIFFSMSKGTKSFGHDKALACESRGFVYNKKGCIVLTHPHRCVGGVLLDNLSATLNINAALGSCRHFAA